MQGKRAKVQEQMAETIVELADYASKDGSLAAGSGGQKAVDKIVKGSHGLSGNQAAIDRTKEGNPKDGGFQNAYRPDLKTRKPVRWFLTFPTVSDAFQ